jgi:hypothetical protein
MMRMLARWFQSEPQKRQTLANGESEERQELVLAKPEAPSAPESADEWDNLDDSTSAC